MMNDFFRHNMASWIRYDDYVWKTAPDGQEYLIPAEGAKPNRYKVFDEAETLVTDALQAAMTAIVCREDEAEIHRAIREFVCKYGLLGIMTALPATTKFMDYEKVFLPKNFLIRDEVLDTEQYLDMFFPFGRPDMSDPTEFEELKKLVFMYFAAPDSVPMATCRQYGERYDWLKKIFQDWMFVFFSVMVYSDKKSEMDADMIQDIQDGLSAFDGNAPTYHFRLYDGPVIVWDFHSLLLVLQMAISMMLTDPKNQVKFCKGCGRPFVAKNRNMKYCSKECRNYDDKL